MATPLTLQVFKGDTLITAQEFTRDIIKIGRLSSAHLRLDDEKVSRVHCVIEAAADGTLSIIDMGSVEGTFVNGKRVNKSRVTFGDEIRVGGTTLRLEKPAAAAPAEPSLTAPEKHEAVEPAPEALVAEPTPHVPAVRRSKARGPLGVSLRFQWGTQRLGEFFLPPGQKKSFSVGTAAGVDFVMGDARLGSPRLEVLRTDGQTFSVCFTGKMKGGLLSGGETLDIEALIESGKASHEDSAYSLVLEAEDTFWVDLGGVTMEASFQPVPRRVRVPLADVVDYRAVNIFLLMLFAGSMFVIAAANRPGEDESFADELTGDTSRLTKLIIKPPEPQTNRLIARLNEQKDAKQQRSQPARPEPKKPRSRPAGPPVARPGQPTSQNKRSEARQLAQQLFGQGKGLSSVFSNTGLSSDFRNAIHNVASVGVGTPGGIGGLVTRTGAGGPTGGGSTIGLGGIRTQGRDTGYAEQLGRPGGLTGKVSVDPVIAPSEVDIKEGSLDKELVRKVIQDHKSQIRSCFESLLNQYPDLNGKVQTQFTIGPDGRVLTAKVAQSTTGSRELDGCVASRVRLWEFPKPKGGGVVVVSYPFLFKQSGR